MEFTASKKDLAKLVSRMQGVTDKKASAALGCVLIDAGAFGVRMMATDLLVSLEGTMAGAEVKREGSAALPCKELAERVKMMPDGPLTLSVDAKWGATLKAAGSARKFTLRGMPGDEFPALPKPADAPAVTLPAAMLLNLIATSSFSISPDATRPHLNSALFQWNGDQLRMVTTDGHRLSKTDLVIEGRAGALEMLIPLKAIQEIARLCEEHGAGDIEVTRSGSSAFFRAGTVVFVTKLTEAHFPPYEQVIPKAPEVTVESISRADLASALRAVAVSAEAAGGVKLTLTPGKMTISSQSKETGAEGSDEIVVGYQGRDRVIGFCAKYVSDVLAALDEEEIQFAISGELDPILIKPVSAREFVAVVMPMRI